MGLNQSWKESELRFSGAWPWVNQVGEDHKEFPHQIWYHTDQRFIFNAQKLIDK